MRDFSRKTPSCCHGCYAYRENRGSQALNGRPNHAGIRYPCTESNYLFGRSYGFIAQLSGFQVVNADEKPSDNERQRQDEDQGVFELNAPLGKHENDSSTLGTQDEEGRSDNFEPD